MLGGLCDQPLAMRDIGRKNTVKFFCKHHAFIMALRTTRR
jgi:hypothetical protein